jgi:DNA repair protein RadC
VVRRALANSAAAIILVQNSAGACPFARDTDIVFTTAAIDAAVPLDIAVHDHLLLGTEDHISLRGSGLIWEQVEENFSHGLWSILTG